MYRFFRLFSGLLCVAGLFAAGSAQSATISDTDGDTTITLTLDDSITEGLDQVWGTLQIVIEDDLEIFTAGDDIEISVWDENTLFDTELWEWFFVVSAAEVSAGHVDRTFDVSWLAAPESPTDNVLEVYGYAVVDKWEAWSWNDDVAQTEPIDVTVVPIPEPGTFALLSLGLFGLAVHPRRVR